MIKIDKSIEIVSSTVTSLSSMGKTSRNAALVVLEKHYTKVVITIINNLSDLKGLVDRKPDLVFLGMDFVLIDQSLGLYDPDKVWLAEYLDKHNIAYTGSTRTGHENEHHKPRAKQKVLDAGLRTANYKVIKQNCQLAKSDINLKYPLFVKPTNYGGGTGIDCNSLVNNFDALDTKVLSISNNVHSDSLIEEYLPGREFSVAILKDENSAKYFVMPIELVAPQDECGTRMLSRQVKSSNSEQAIEVTDQNIKNKVSTLAMNVFIALEARDYGRIDIRLDKLGNPNFLEANLIPCLIAGYGSFPKACLQNIGMDHEEMILSIARLGLARNKEVYQPSHPTSMLVKSIT